MSSDWQTQVKTCDRQDGTRAWVACLNGSKAGPRRQATLITDEAR